LCVKRRLLRYGRGRLNELDGLFGDDYAVTSSAGKEGGAGAIGFVVFGVVVLNGGLFGGSLYFFLAAPIVRAARHAGKEEDVQGEKEQQPFHGVKVSGLGLSD
jgi:hypothetical protein